MDATSVSDVFLLRGSSKVPMLQELVQVCLRIRGIQVSINREEKEPVVAALVGAMLCTASTKDVQSLSICDATTLSVSCVAFSLIIQLLALLSPKQNRLEVLNKKTVIPRKTPIPAINKTVINFWFSRRGHKKRSMMTLYEGDDMKKLGKFEFTDIPSGASKITILFEINSDGILEVSAEAENKNITISSEVKDRFTRVEMFHLIQAAWKYRHEDDHYYKTKLLLVKQDEEGEPSRRILTAIWNILRPKK